MKPARLLAPLALLVFLAPGLAPSVLAQKGVEIVSISANSIKTADVNYSGDKRRTPPSQNWMEFEVEFGYRPSAADPKILEDLNFKYFVYIKSLDKVFSGEVAHMHVAEGKPRYSVMYIAPQTLSFLADGKTVQPSDVDPVAVQAFYKGQLVAETSSRGAPKGQWWSSKPNVPGVLLNKNQTPFSALYWDRYELIKPEAR